MSAETPSVLFSDLGLPESLLTALREGVVTVYNGGAKTQYDVHGGFADVNGEVVRAVVNAHQLDNLHAHGLDARDPAAVGAQLRAILKGERDTSDWPELAMFALVRDVPNRHGSALLPFEALRQLFDRAHARG